MSTPTVLISPAELDALVEAEPVVVIDTRDADTYAAGHIPGAVNLREIFTFLATSTAEGLTGLKGTFAKHFGAVGLSGKETAVFYGRDLPHRPEDGRRDVDQGRHAQRCLGQERHRHRAARRA